MAGELRQVLTIQRSKPYREFDWFERSFGLFWTITAWYQSSIDSDDEMGAQILRFTQPDQICCRVPDANRFFAANEELLTDLENLHAAGKLDRVFQLLKSDHAPDLLEVGAAYGCLGETHCLDLMNETICILNIENGENSIGTMLNERQPVVIPFAGKSVIYRIPFDKLEELDVCLMRARDN